MLRSYAYDEGRLRAIGPGDDASAVVWHDLDTPTEAEETALEAALGIDIPTREEMEEIEQSARLYVDGGAVFMTATLPAQAETDAPQMAAVTFVLTPASLVTVRYHAPRAFETFPLRAHRMAPGCDRAPGVLLALLETTIERQADILERISRDVDGASHRIFRAPDLKGRKPRSQDEMRDILREVGRTGGLTSNLRQSLVSLERLLSYLALHLSQQKGGRDDRARIKTLARDVQALLEHAYFLADKTTFLLDATLGLINIEQNAIIKIFSVAAVVFLPPTLVASIYGMNFEAMPELSWPFGYPFALGLMILSATLPYLYFKRRGWL